MPMSKLRFVLLILWSVTFLGQWGCNSVNDSKRLSIAGAPAKTPKDAVSGYLFALRDWDFYRAYDYKFNSELSRQEYVEDMVGLEWRVIQFQVHREDIESQESAKVIVSSLVYSEGELSMDRMDFQVRSDTHGWLVDGFEWGPSIPIAIPKDWKTKLELR